MTTTLFAAAIAKEREAKMWADHAEIVTKERNEPLPSEAKR